MADEVKNIFVSHQHNDADKIEDFKEELKNLSELYYNIDKN